MTSSLKEALYEKFSRHAISMTGENAIYDPLAILCKENERFCGALVYQPFWGAMHIKYLVTEESMRGRGIGTMLMERAFEIAKLEKMPFAFVETMSFQALGFYQKMGFILEYTRSGYSHGTAFHYLRKDF